MLCFQDEFKVTGARILDNDRKHADFNNEEACIQLYVDIIQVRLGVGGWRLGDLGVLDGPGRS